MKNYDSVPTIFTKNVMNHFFLLLMVVLASMLLVLSASSEEEIVLFDDHEIKITWNGFEDTHTTGLNFHPNLYIENNSAEQLKITPYSFYVNNCLMSVSNSNTITLEPGTRLMLATKNVWLLSTEDLIDAYGYTTIEKFSVSLTIKLGDTTLVDKKAYDINTETDIFQMMKSNSYFRKKYPTGYEENNSNIVSENNMVYTSTPIIELTPSKKVQTTPSPSPTIKSNAWICPSCNNEITSKFCPNCGTSMPSPSPTPEPTFTPVPMNINSPVQNVVNYTYLLRTTLFEREGTYTGELVDGYPHGYGIFVTHNSENVEWFYKGQWEYGVPNGDGAEYWEIGKVVKGTFAQGVFMYGDTVVPGAAVKWLDEYDNAGNQKYVILNEGKVYEVGYVNRMENDVVSYQYYDTNGMPTDKPQQFSIEIFLFP